jgi:hypothetical protein
MAIHSYYGYLGGADRASTEHEYRVVIRIDNSLNQADIDLCFT